LPTSPSFYQTAARYAMASRRHYSLIFYE